MQTVVEWYQLKSFVIDLRCLIPEVDIAAITEVIISRVDEFRRLFLAIIFMFLKTACSATSIPMSAMSRFTGSTNMALLNRQ